MRPQAKTGPCLSETKSGELGQALIQAGGSMTGGRRGCRVEMGTPRRRQGRDA